MDQQTQLELSPLLDWKPMQSFECWCDVMLWFKVAHDSGSGVHSPHKPQNQTDDATHHYVV